MKRIVLFSMLFALVGFSFAAKKKNAEPASAATPEVSAPAKAFAASKSEAPSLWSNEPKFQGFTGSFIKYGKMSAGSREFTIRVEHSPWFFEYSGKVNAAHNTADLDIYSDEVVAVVAYYDAAGKTSEGQAYQAGMFDVMLFLEDEQTRISEAKVKLIGPAGQESAGSDILAKAKTHTALTDGAVFKDAKFEKQITQAQADALDKSAIIAAQKVEQKRIADSVATERKRVADSVATEKKRVADSIATEQKRVEKLEKARKKELKRQADSVATYQAEQQRIADEAAAPKKKKKKKAVVEESSDEEAVVADEEEAPVVKKKKKKKKKVVVEDEEAEEE